jgi:hypothetical protein
VRQKNNFVKFLSQFNGYYENMIVGLVDYGDGDLDFELPCEKIIIQGDNDNKLWSKEIIINQIIDKIDTDYLIWIDGDLIYENLDWLNDIDKIVDGNDFVQLFDTINYLGENGEILEKRKGIVSAGRNDIDNLLGEGYMPGGAWLGKTSILKRHKLFEQMYVGGGDTIFVYGLFGVTNGWTLDRVRENNGKIFRNATNWINKLENYKISRIEQTISHLFHGDLSKRDYNSRYKKLSKITNNKIVVYTCISGNYDSLKEIISSENDIDYICFTDQKIESSTWDIRKIPEYLFSLEQAKRARCIKILPHILFKEYEISVWVDGSIQIKGDVKEFIKENLKEYFAISKHPDRICTYDEAEAIKKLHKDSHEIVDKQIEEYRRDSYPRNNGLVQSGIIIRKHNRNESIEICENWWNELKSKSKRDQLSFNYSIWKKDVLIDIINPSIFCSKYFQLYTHDGSIAKIRKDYGELKNFINGKEV